MSGTSSWSSAPCSSRTRRRVEVRNFQGIYLSPQQAKALHTILQQNLVNYENTFGEIKLDPRVGPGAGRFTRKRK